MKMFVVLKKILAIIIGAGIMAAGINAFVISNNLADGGVAGISILLKYLFDINPGLSLMLLNIPLLIWGYSEFGARSMVYTILGTASLAFFLWFFGDLSLHLDDLLLAALYAGVTVGFGLGIIFRFGGTTGGVDILARVLNKHLGMSFGSVIFQADLVILAFSLLVLDLQQFMYTLVAVFISTRVVDIVQQGAYRAKAVTVVSRREEPIARAVLDELGRGVTIFKGIGAYTQTETSVLYIVCSRFQTVKVKNLIHEKDPTAFVTITDVHEVIGEGFQRIQEAPA